MTTVPDSNPTIAEALRELRQHLGMSQQVFATKLGISIRSLAHYEKGHRKPRAEVLSRVVFLADNHGQPQLKLVFQGFMDEVLIPRAVLTRLYGEIQQLRLENERLKAFEAERLRDLKNYSQQYVTCHRAR
jgi:transcriptional regulator with XRE-family HTH domain